jgi:hypothetical protein
MNNTAWKAARKRAADAWVEQHGEAAPAGFGTFESTIYTLSAAGCGHRSGRIATHYSQAELTSLIEAAEKVCDTESRKSPATTWLRRKTR